MLSQGAIAAHAHTSDTFIDTDSGGLEAGDAMSLHEEDLSLEEGDEDDTANVGLDLSAPKDLLETDKLLEELLSPGPTVADPAEFSLDDLLAESLATAAESASIKAARKKLKDTRTSKRERQELEAKIANWEVQREWTPKAAVAMFNLQVCACGSRHSIFAGLFQRQTHRVSAVDRWVHAEEVADSGLPRENKAHTTQVLLCADCAFEAGYGDCSDHNYLSIRHIITSLSS